jgi:hypothetical protein
MMDKLFRVQVKSDEKWDKKSRNLYVVSEDKDAARKRVDTHIRSGFHIERIFYLGCGMDFGGHLFTSSKKTE